MSKEENFIKLISGQSTGCGAHVSRAALLLAEQLYKPAISIRNSLFNNGFKATHDLGKPVISVGNITTGGTGKTPVVRWLTDQLLKQNLNPAILMRGYRSRHGLSDEAELLKRPGIEVQANPDRVAGARSVLSKNPNVNVFVLDDGFQHRRARRDFDLVLIDAGNPFGFDHVLPRGLLREPPSGLSRANAILITHVDQTSDLDQLLARIRQYNPNASIFQCRHRITGLIDQNDNPLAINNLGESIAVAGIGNPSGFMSGLANLGLTVTQLIQFADHHPYSQQDLNHIQSTANGKTILTTEKDWTKLKHLSGIKQLPIARAVLEIDFVDSHDAQLLELINRSI